MPRSIDHPAAPARPRAWRSWRPAASSPRAAGDPFVHESYIGSQFNGRVEALTRVGDFPAIVPSVEGWARVYGHNLITVDPDDDPFWAGFAVT